MSLDSVITAINAANVRLNGKVETLQPTGGQLVGNTNSFSQQTVNSAWRKMQAVLADMRYTALQLEQTYSTVPVAGSTDPLAQAFFNTAGYNDGATNWPAFALPATLIRPYELSERISGTAANFLPMDLVPWSLPRVAKIPWNRQWIWRNQTIYVPGATSQTDVVIIYASLLADFLDTGNTPWFQGTIPLVNAVDTFADYICREIYTARGDMDGAMAFQASGAANAKLMVNQDTTQGKSVLKNSELQKMADKYTPGNATETTSTVKR